MEENKNALKIERKMCNCNNTDNLIIPEKQHNYNFLPVILRNILVCCIVMFFDLNITVILNILLVKIAHMITSKRILISEGGIKINPNYYAMVFVCSGYGKDRLVRFFNDFIFVGFKTWFQKMSEDNYNKQLEQIKIEAENTYKGNSPKDEAKKQNFIKEESKKIRRLVLEISNGTQEGLYADAKAFKQANRGSLFMTIPEFGNFLDVKTDYNQQFLNATYEGYDGKILNKCIKSEQREPDIENMPLNILFYSDPTRLLTTLKQPILSMFDTGLNRRTIVSFQPNTKLKKIILSLKQEKEFYEKAKSLGDDLCSIFDKLQENAVYEVSSEAKDLLNNYKLQLTDLFNSNECRYLQDEYKSRELKALKLSGLYACLNHHNRHVIEPNDMQQAIDTIEYLSKDFAKFVNYKIVRNDLYDNVFNFFESNLGKPFTKSELITKRFKEIGITREKFKKEFDSIIEVVKAIAENKGYCFIEKNINNNSGKEYTLMEVSPTNSELMRLIQ